MAKFNREGTLYIKNVTGVTVASDGVMKGAFAKAIPPYSVVNRYWVTCWITGAKAVPMHAKQHVVVSGRMANMPGEVNDLASGGTHDTIEELIGAYIPRHGQEPFDGDQADVASTDLIGQGYDMSLWAKSREWLHYEAMLGGGKNSFITKADAIRFSANYTKSGTISGYGCNVDQWRLIAIDINTNGLSDDINQSVEEHVWGDTVANPEVLARGLYQFYGNQGLSSYHPAVHGAETEDDWASTVRAPDLDRAGLSEGNPDHNTVTKWARTGYGDPGSWDAGTSDDTTAGSGFKEDCPLILQTKVTLEIKTLKPRITNMWTPN